MKHYRRVTILAVLLVVFCATAVGQQNVNNTSSNQPQNVPHDCEYNSISLDAVYQAAGKDGLVIIIARLGDGETNSRLSWRRLRAAREYLVKTPWQKPEQSVVLAEGARTKGYGRLEFYTSGRLGIVIAGKRNRNIPFTSCAR